MGFLQVHGVVVLFVLVFMTILWVISLILKNSSIVDPMWGTGLVLSNWVAFALSPNGFPARKWLISILVTIWGVRLSVHLLRRNWGTGEDFRYQQWREEAGPKWWSYSYLRVFFVQGLVMCVLATAPVAAQVSPAPANLTFFDLAAIPVWATGFLFEAVGVSHRIRPVYLDVVIALLGDEWGPVRLQLRRLIVLRAQPSPAESWGANP
jgi:steroid 5-alpha reductase family enzyme